MMKFFFYKDITHMVLYVSGFSSVNQADFLKHQRGYIFSKVTIGRLLRNYFFFDIYLWYFFHSTIKAWQAVLALLFLTLPCPINLISEAFWFTVETRLGNRGGRSCQSIQLTHTVWSEVSASPGDHTVQITCAVFDLSRTKYLLVLCLSCAYFHSEYVLT